MPATPVSRSRRRFLELALVIAAGVPGGVRAEPHPFSVRRVDGEYIVEGSLTVAVPPLVAWEVLTDYDDMSRFVVDMRESRVLESVGEQLRVLQRGVTRLGPLSFDYEVEREVTLDPHRAVRSRAVRGNMRKLDMETLLTALADGVRVDYRAVLVPDFWVPPLFGPAVLRRQAERQFEALIAEMRRRAGARPVEP
jgi:hypothetical protein